MVDNTLLIYLCSQSCRAPAACVPLCCLLVPLQSVTAEERHWTLTLSPSSNANVVLHSEFDYDHFAVRGYWCENDCNVIFLHVFKQFLGDGPCSSFHYTIFFQSTARTIARVSHWFTCSLAQSKEAKYCNYTFVYLFNYINLVQIQCHSLDQ